MRKVTVYMAGTLAYVDTLRSGLVPCKVIWVNSEWAYVRITAARYGYPRGIKVYVSTRHLVPRRSICRRLGAWLIKNDYEWWPSSAT